MVAHVAYTIGFIFESNNFPPKYRTPNSKINLRENAKIQAPPNKNEMRRERLHKNAETKNPKNKGDFSTLVFEFEDHRDR